MVTMELQELFKYVPYLNSWWKFDRQSGFNCA